MNMEDLFRKATRRKSKDVADPYLIAEELGRGPQIGFGPSGARATLDNLTAA